MFAPDMREYRRLTTLYIFKLLNFVRVICVRYFAFDYTVKQVGANSFLLCIDSIIKVVTIELPKSRNR